MKGYLKQTLLLTLGISIQASATSPVWFLFTTLADQQGYFLLGFIGIALLYVGYTIGAFSTSFFIEVLGLKRCIILGVLGQTTSVLASMSMYFIQSQIVVYSFVIILSGISGVSWGIMLVSQGTYMTKMIEEDKRALMFGIYFSGVWSGAVCGTTATYALLTVIRTEDILFIYLISILLGTVPLQLLPNAPLTENDQYYYLEIQSHEPGVTALICLWSYVGLINVYMMSIMPYYIRLATDSNKKEEILNVTLILSVAILGRVTGGLVAGYFNRWIGESGVIGVSSAVIVFGLGSTLYLTTVPFNYYWIPIGFWIGSNEGMTQTIGMKLASILSRVPQNVFKKTRAMFGFTCTLAFLFVSYIIAAAPAWAIIMGIIAINLVTSSLTIKGHQEYLKASQWDQGNIWNEQGADIELEEELYSKILN